MLGLERRCHIMTFWGPCVHSTGTWALSESAADAIFLSISHLLIWSAPARNKPTRQNAISCAFTSAVTIARSPPRRHFYGEVQKLEAVPLPRELATTKETSPAHPQDSRSPF